MVRAAEQWQPAPLQRICETAPNRVEHDIPADNNQQLEVALSTNACQDSSSEIRYLEHVQARLSLKFKPRGNLKITLISPMGTPTNLLLPRPRDADESSFNNWPFLTVSCCRTYGSNIHPLFPRRRISGANPRKAPGGCTSRTTAPGRHVGPENCSRGRLCFTALSSSHSGCTSRTPVSTFCLAARPRRAYR